MTRTDARNLITENARRTLVVRFINLDGVRSIKLSGKRLQPKERRAADRKAKQLERPWENLEQANREMDALFNTFTF